MTVDFSSSVILKNNAVLVSRYSKKRVGICFVRDRGFE